MESSADTRTPSQIGREAFRILFEERDLAHPYVMRFDSDGRLDENTIDDGAEFARRLGMLPPRDSAADRLTPAAFNAKTRLGRRLGRGR